MLEIIVVEFCVLVGPVAESVPLGAGLRVYVDEVVESHEAHGA